MCRRAFNFYKLNTMIGTAARRHRPDRYKLRKIILSVFGFLSSFFWMFRSKYKKRGPDIIGPAV